MDVIHLEVLTAEQKLFVFKGTHILNTFPVSTSKIGLGETRDSYRTPRGKHLISDKIGAGSPPGTIFKSRQPTGEIWDSDQITDDDLILTRILRLSGTEPHNANSHNRYIYIHGTNHESLIGTPASLGCIRMTNSDVALLFDMVHVGTPVTILPPA